MPRASLYDSTYDPLTNEEELYLATAVRTAEEISRRRSAGETVVDAENIVGHAAWAREKLIRHHLRLVAEIARQYRSTGVPLIDLFYAGIRGLEAAVDRYQPRRGFRFKPHATYWIRQSVIDTVTSILGAAPETACSALEVTVRTRESSLSARERDLLTQHFGLFGVQPRSQAELAAAYHLPPRAVQRQVTAALRRLGIDSDVQRRLRTERRARMASHAHHRPNPAQHDRGAQDVVTLGD